MLPLPSPSPHRAGTGPGAPTKGHQRLTRLPILPSRGAGPGGARRHPDTHVRQGYSHLRSALWYRRPWVCLSTCSGHLLMCLRVSLQNSWCLRDSSQARVQIHSCVPWPRLRITPREADGGGLPCGLGIRILPSFQATAACHSSRQPHCPPRKQAQTAWPASPDCSSRRGMWTTASQRAGQRDCLPPPSS